MKVPLEFPFLPYLPSVNNLEFSSSPSLDPTAAARKKDHIELAFSARLEKGDIDGRFYFEPMLAAHPKPGSLPAQTFLGKSLKVPLWVSSMTGGTALAGTINHHLARACGEFGMGMGLGSCRQLLHSTDHFRDFDVRPFMGHSVPLFANLGIAQIEQLLAKQEVWRIRKLLDDLSADGLIAHVNPLQEAMQPEGDRFLQPPLQTIEQLLAVADFPLIVKEVGQGMGPASLRALLQLPLAGVEFAAAGGTNFARLELLRSDPAKQAIYTSMAKIGHSAEEMTRLVNALEQELGPRCLVHNVIISGGISDFLEGYYLTQLSEIPAIYGQASAFLKYARHNYEELQNFVQENITGLELAHAFLHVKK